MRLAQPIRAREGCLHDRARPHSHASILIKLAHAHRPASESGIVYGRTIEKRCRFVPLSRCLLEAAFAPGLPVGFQSKIERLARRRLGDGNRGPEQAKQCALHGVSDTMTYCRVPTQSTDHGDRLCRRGAKPESACIQYACTACCVAVSTDVRP